jgi:predicted O-methyltransferase YrrM
MECGTSFGLATIYIALALNQSTPGKQGNDCRIFTVEKDGSKVAKAKEIWTEAWKDVES